jgi:HNH endonuclease
MTTYGLSPTPLARFHDKYVVTKTGCWEWKGARQQDGYGVFEQVPAHRWSYITFRGAIPAGLQIHHRCENPSCVNPMHLEVCTARENTLKSRRAPAAVNARKTHCHRGHEFTPENTYVHNGSRNCRTCQRARGRDYRLRLKRTGPVAAEPVPAERPAPVSKQEMELSAAWEPTSP